MTPRRPQPSKTTSPQPSAHIESTVTLRALITDDVQWLDGWLARVAASVAYNTIDLKQPGASLLQRLREEQHLHPRVIERSGEDVGLLVYRLDAAKGAAAMFEFVGIPPEGSRLGSGMMAAAAAEREMHDAGARTIHAPAPAVHGIDVYFWIRLGYRPLQRSDWPCECTGVLWMRRDLDQ